MRYPFSALTPIDRTTFSLVCLELFFIFGLDPITHIRTLEKGESDSSLKFKILRLFCVSCENLTSFFVWMVSPHQCLTQV